MARGIEGRDIFLDDEDRLEFLLRFSTCLTNCGYECLTWTLMDNHYHLIVRTNHLPMEELMRPLNTGYALYYNKKYERNGYLFQGRFKSVLCQDQNYAAEVIKYVNMNPIRAGLVKSVEALKNWTWCGHGYLIGMEGAKGEAFQNREECLKRFGEEEKIAITNYLNFMTENFAPEKPQSAGLLSSVEAKEMAGAEKGWPAVIGNPEFVTQAMSMHKISTHRKHRQADYPYVLDKIAAEVCTEFRIRREDLMCRGKKNVRSDARAAFCYRLHIDELIPLTRIADYLKITIPPIAILVQKGRLKMTVPALIQTNST